MLRRATYLAVNRESSWRMCRRCCLKPCVPHRREKNWPLRRLTDFQLERMTVREKEIEKLHRLPATKNLGFESATGIFRHKPTNRTAYVPCGESER